MSVLPIRRAKELTREETAGAATSQMKPRATGRHQCHQRHREPLNCEYASEAW